MRWCTCCPPSLPFIPLHLQRLPPPSTLSKAPSKSESIQKTSSPSSFPWKASFLNPPEIARSMTLFPLPMGKVTSPKAYANPVTMWIGWQEGLVSGSPCPFLPPHPTFRVQAQLLCSSLSSSHLLVQKEPRTLVRPGLLHGQRTALPAKPPGRPITKLYTVPCALSL